MKTTRETLAADLRLIRTTIAPRGPHAMSTHTKIICFLKSLSQMTASVQEDPSGRFMVIARGAIIGRSLDRATAELTAKAFNRYSKNR